MNEFAELSQVRTLYTKEQKNSKWGQHVKQSVRVVEKFL